MLETIYNFLYTWLYNGVQPAFLTEQGAEFLCIVATLTVLAFVLVLAFYPIKMLITWIFRGV